MSGRPAFLTVDLAYGRHSERWDLPVDQPVLIAGPNGSGKTTIVDGLLRTVFGFNRKRPPESALCDARRPWRGEEFRSSVRLRTPEGDVVLWSRDHLTDEVSVRTEDGSVLFRGAANPGSSGSADHVYWELVERVFGVTGIEAYARTSFVGQGVLLETEFGSDLLRLAEGGHARLQRALERIDARHRELTRKSVIPGGRRLNADRPLEQDRRALETVAAELASARTARAEGDAVEQRLAELAAEISGAESAVERLERARTELAERLRLDAEAEAAGRRLDHLVELREELEAARRDVREADEEAARQRSAGEYPDDFPARIERLRTAWDAETRARDEIADRGRELERNTPRRADSAIPLAAGLLASAAAIAALLLDLSVPGLAGVGLAIVLAVAVAGLATARAADRRATRRAAESALARERRELDAIRERIRTALLGVPDAASLAPATASDRLHGFERGRAAARRLAETRRRHREAVRRVEESAEAKASPGRSLPLLISDAERDLAEIRVRRRRLEELAMPPAGELPRTPREIDDGLKAGRARLEELRGEREELRIRLDRAGRAASDLSRLERERDELGRRVAEAEASVAALCRAHALLRDGYEAFRDEDEARLVAAISRRLGELGDPPLGPFRAENGLTGPTVGLDGRRFAADSPALSHGQRHLVMLAIRLGTADFLAADGVAAPLIVDEPFAHLDDRHAAQVWDLLRRVAEERQVVVSTQETRLLARLGVEPVVRLADRLSNGGGAARQGSESTERRPVETETAVGAETGGGNATS